MISRLRPSFLAAALALCGPAALASPPLVAAQLAAIPTSPGFRMEVNKGESGAPEATAVGARPIELRRGAAGAPAAASGASSPAGRAGPDGRKPAVAAAADRAASAPADPLERLRQRLAEKLGATPGTGGKYVMRVSNSHGESGENVVAAVRPGAAATAGAHRAAARSAEGAAALPGAADPHAANALLPTHWDYAGTGGPDAWGRLQPEYAKCSTGMRQSPIDIRGGIAVDLEPIQFDYRPSAFSVVDNGHTVQVNVEAGNAITITGRRYELVQFHFHRPSEERIDGRQFDMVAHLVHKDPEGRLAVVAVLLDRGSAQPIVQAVWNNLPLEKGDEVRAGSRIDLAQLLPGDKRYYTYMGSLTTPPCSEGVLWMVMKEPVPVSPEQVAIFSRLYPMNARPIQQASGRLIKQSN
jgi:carbonic anhydrase